MDKYFLINIFCLNRAIEASVFAVQPNITILTQNLLQKISICVKDQQYHVSISYFENWLDLLVFWEKRRLREKNSRTWWKAYY